MERTQELDEIRQYLLRQLSEDQQQSIEQRLLVEDDLFEELEITETQLVDDYVAGNLTSEENKQFDEHFLSTPERRQSLQFARVFRRYVDSRPIPRNHRAVKSWWQRWEGQAWELRAAAAVIAVAVIAVALWFAIPRPSSELLATVTLTISSSNRAEGNAAQKIPLPSGTLKIVLQLPDDSAPETIHRVRLIGDDGETRTFEVTERAAKTVSLTIPANQLKRGSYALKLLTVNAAGAEQPLSGSYLLTIE